MESRNHGIDKTQKKNPLRISGGVAAARSLNVAAAIVCRTDSFIMRLHFLLTFLPTIISDSGIYRSRPAVSLAVSAAISAMLLLFDDELIVKEFRSST